VRNERLIKQIQFPKIVLPIAESVSEFINFLFGMALLLAMAFLFFGAHLSLNLLWLPVIMAVQYVLILGLSFMVAAFTVFYRDVGIVIGHLMRLLFFVSPILWSLDAAAGRGADIKLALGETLYKLLEYNPIAILLGAYRHVIYGQLRADADGTITWGPAGAPDLASLGVLLGIAMVLLILGTWLFKRLEPAFAKVL
jgi:ABC-type polysaccharide/polyol phosphate export permease